MFDDECRSAQVAADDETMLKDRADTLKTCGMQPSMAMMIWEANEEVVDAADPLVFGGASFNYRATRGEVRE
jgi:hypothetical protein